MNCKDCRFFNEVGNQYGGMCVKYAPRPGEYKDGVDWPFVNFDDWCGEFEARTRRGK